MLIIRYGGCYCKDGGYGYESVDKRLLKQVTSYYRCFKDMVKSSNDKVLLITHQSNEITTKKLLNTTINCYGLNADKLYFAYNSQQSKFVQVELLDNNDAKLQAENIISKEEIDKALKLCTTCSF